MDQKKSIIVKLVKIAQKAAKWMQKKQTSDYFILKNTMNYKKYRKKYKVLETIVANYNESLSEEIKWDKKYSIYMPPYRDFCFWIHRNHLEDGSSQEYVYNRYLKDKGLH